MFTILCTPLQRSLWQFVRHYSHQLNPKAVVITAAVRTPKTFHQHDKDESHLAARVIDELVKRAAVPRDEYKRLIFCGNINNEAMQGLTKNLGLKRCQAHAIHDQNCSITGLQMCLQSLQKEDNECIILVDTRNRLNQQHHPILPSELITIDIPYGRTAPAPQNIASEEGSGAAAITLTTAEVAERLQIKPLAVVREFFVEDNGMQARLHPQMPQDMYSWQLAISQEKMDTLNQKLVVRHDVTQITTSHLLTHAVHALPAGRIGCVVLESSSGKTLTLLLEKLNPHTGSLPQLTLYTKDPCPLCDELVEQLEQSFPGEFELKKVFIDRKENVRYLRLFRYDIPVLFLNGQFLCMHRLNEEALRDKLDEIKNTKSNL